MKRLRHIEVYRAQRCWVCEVTFLVLTSHQFTNEEHTVKHGGKWIVSAIFLAIKDAVTVYRKLKAKRGERESLGWHE